MHKPFEAKEHFETIKFSYLCCEFYIDVASASEVTVKQHKVMTGVSIMCGFPMCICIVLYLANLVQ